MKRKMLWLFIILLVSVIGVYARLNVQDLQKWIGLGSPPVVVRVKASRLIFANGIVEGRQRETDLHFEVNGRIISIEAREGDRIKKGDVLVRLDQTLLIQELAEANARLTLARVERERLLNGASKETRAFLRAKSETAKAKLAHATKQLQRGIQLNQKRALSGQDLEDEQGIFDVASAELKAALAQLEEAESPTREDDLRVADARISMEEVRIKKAETMLSKTELIAPCNGLVLKTRGELGELVEPQTGTAIITIADDGETRVRAFVEEIDALVVASGRRAYITVGSLPGASFLGTVIFLAPSMGPKRLIYDKPSERLDVKTREVVILLDKQDKLVIGLPVDVFIDSKAAP